MFLQGMSKSDSSSRLYHGSPYLSKLESISSSAVRAADKVGASLIVVYTHTGDHGWLLDPAGFDLVWRPGWMSVGGCSCTYCFDYTTHCTTFEVK